MLSKEEKAHHNFHIQKSKNRMRHIRERLDRFTLFVFEMANCEGISEKASKRLIQNIGLMRRSILMAANGCLKSSLHASDAIEKLQKAIKVIKSKKEDSNILPKA